MINAYFTDMMHVTVLATEGGQVQATPIIVEQKP
jgi:hypothetical protein